MKHLKKVIALVLTAFVALAVTTTAYAATITINQNNEDGAAGEESYNLYKIFDVTKTAAVTEDVTTDDTLGAGTAEGFSYTISKSNPWFDVINDGDQNWVSLAQSAGDENTYNVTWVGQNTADAANAFAVWLRDNKGNIAADETMVSYNGEATKADVEDGYWLIDSTLGTNLVLATSNITINTKNSYPTTEKTVAETNYNVGDKVQYTITVELPASVDYSKTITVHDTMDNVLALDANSVHAKVVNNNDFDDNLTLVLSEDFDADHASGHAAADGKSLFDFVLDISSLAPGEGETATAQTITITYEAELLSTAAADTNLVNKEFVEYSEYTTPEKEADTETYDFNLRKVFTGSEENDANLQATFILVTDADDENSAIQFVTDSTGYVKKDSDDTGADVTITVGDDATVNVRGLAAGTYYLIEKTTADGYNLLTTPITVTIDEEGNATVNSDALFTASDSTITVTNNTGAVLPSTGGIGTTIFYVVGGILIAGAVVYLITKKRASAE